MAFFTLPLPISLPIKVHAAVAYPNGNWTLVEAKLANAIFAEYYSSGRLEAIIELTSCNIHSRETKEPMGMAVNRKGFKS